MLEYNAVDESGGNTRRVVRTVEQLETELVDLQEKVSILKKELKLIKRKHSQARENWIDLKKAIKNLEIQHLMCTLKPEELKPPEVRQGQAVSPHEAPADQKKSVQKANGDKKNSKK